MSAEEITRAGAGAAPPAGHGRGARLAARVALAAFLLHAIGILWAWASWEPGLRGSVLTWIDLPVSLLFVGATGRPLLVASLLVGGLEWATAAAVLTLLVARLARRRPRP